MAWGSTFLSAIASDAGKPRLMLVIRPDATPDWLPAGLQGEHVITSYPSSTGMEAMGDVCRVSGARLDLQTMRYSSAALQVEIVGESTVRALIDPHADNGYGVRRGSIVELRAGFGSMAEADFETVFTGRLQSLSKSGGIGARTTYLLTAYDIVSHLQAQSNPEADARGLMFYSTGPDGETTVLAAPGYTAGDATINVVSTTGFELETGSSRGLIQVDNGTDAPFLIRYTGTTATTFTGCSGGSFTTSAANSSAGSEVRNCAWMQAHPLNILRRMAVSQIGDGTNSAWDDYPAAWGWGIPSDYVDTNDISDWITASDSSTTWNLIALEPVANPLRWMEDHLSCGGFFPAMRQGLLTGRFLEDAQAAPSVAAPIDLTDTWIESVPSWDLHDPGQPVEHVTITAVNGREPFAITSAEEAMRRMYVRYRVEEPWPDPSATSADLDTAGGASATLPLQDGRLVDHSAHLWGPSYAAGTEVAAAWTWLTNIPEAITLRGRGWYWSQLCVGDRPELTTAAAFGATECNDGGTGTYSSADVLVVAGPDVDWLHGGVEIQVLRYVERTL